VRTVRATYAHEYVFNTTTYDQASSKNASGRIAIKNELTTKQTFRPQTRFMTEDGLVFRTESWVEVPPARVSGNEVVPGTAEIRVSADMYDREGNVIGARGNIASGILLTIPGLTFNRDKIYGESLNEFEGGADPTVHILTSEELERFRAMAADKLRLGAYEALRVDLARSNKERAEDYAILPTADVITYFDESTSLLGGVKVGNKVEEVRLSGTASVRAYAYDAASARAHLQTILQEMLLFGTEKLIAFNDDSIRISNVISRTDEPFSMKGTTELDATISYDFEDDSNTLTKKLKDLIVNTSFEDARSIMLNNTNIANVRIVSSPFWLSRVVGNPDNIEFVINR
ncbi:MAG TPA: hypothetical protein PK765_07045, partial [bacterium]|nr:hypothetical protein [bacterium]